MEIDENFSNSLNIKLKEAFEVEAEYGAFYTGGCVSWTSCGNELLCQDGEKINVLSINEGKVIKKIGLQSELEKDEIDEDVIYSFCLNDDNEYIVSGHKSGLLKLWSKEEGTLIKVWKSNHNGPISKVEFRLKSPIIASGGSDSTIRIWNYELKSCLSVLKNCVGVISVIHFNPDIEREEVLGAGEDNIINLWNYKTKKLEAQFKGHYSKVTAISFNENNENFVSVGRDKVLILWNIKKKEMVKIIPIYETIEGVFILPKMYKLPNGIDLKSKDNKGKIFAAIAGEEGTIKIWECTESKMVYTQTNSLVTKAKEDGGLAVTQILHCPEKSQLAVVTADHNIMIHDISTFDCFKQLIGFSDEILDICFVGKKENYLAVATNSNDIKFYNTSNMNCQLLKGHTDIVLSLSSYKNLLLSSGKDNTILLWKLEPESFTIKCVAKGTKHTSSVGSVAFGKLSRKIFASVSQDTCLKIWNVPNSFPESDEIISLNCTGTQKAHEKDINCVVISPNDRIIATASQDKSIKLWKSNDLDLIGTLRGHRRGVWCVRFSPIDQIILSTSADSTIRLWSLSDMNCLKSFEGHESSVLRAEFIGKGMQILSASADGLIKLWNIKSSECCTILDKHESRIWAVAINSNENYFYSGGSDSKLILWKDVTEEKKLKEIEQKQEKILQEQELNNLLAEKNTLKALKLALNLEKPNLSLKIINTIIKNKESGLKETILDLNDLNKEYLLKHAIIWNTNSRNCRPAQLVLNILIKEIINENFKPNGLGKILEESIPYTERHFNRITEHLKNLNFIEFTMKCMKIQ